MLKLQCVSDLLFHFQAQGLSSKELVDDLVTICPPEMKGDITVNCFRLARSLRGNPLELAKNTHSFLTNHPDIHYTEVIKGYVNVGLKPTALYRDTIRDETALLADIRLPSVQRRKILIEFSAPNTNKPQHLGHVRNNALGQALSLLLGRVGHEVTVVNLINDRGIHICKSMLAYQRFGNHATPSDSGEKGDHFVGKFYVRFEEEFQRQIAEVKKTHGEYRDHQPEELFLISEIGQAAQKMLQAWENDDSEVKSLWRQLNEWVLAGFEETYNRMNIRFDKVYYESETYDLGKEHILGNLSPSLFYRREDGAIEIDLNDMKLDKKVVLRNDGTAVYVTQDIGTTVLKYNDFSPDEMIWVVGDEQIHHFKVLFSILQKMGFSWAKTLRHIPYGMVNLPEGKMKSREGTVVDADALFDEMIDLAREESLQRCGDDIPPDFDQRVQSIGMGALRFMLLKVNPKTTLTFDPKASIQFEGDTGPFVQYAYARIASIFRKINKLNFSRVTKWELLVEPEEKLLALRCAMYGGVIKQAAAEFDTARVANYLLDLAKDFNRFYKKYSVLSAATDDLIQARLSLCHRIQIILRAGLEVLAIDVPEAM